MISHRVFIGERPEEANKRQTVGHWETDTVWGKGSSALQVLIERKSRFIQIRKIRNKTAQASYEALSDIFSGIDERHRKTITYDNGPENALHSHLNERFKMQSYFCLPYHSWEKGSVENANGLIRRFLPKKTDLDTIPTKTLSRLQHWLNTRPRRCLNFKTPTEAYCQTGALDY